MRFNKINIRPIDKWLVKSTAMAKSSNKRQGSVLTGEEL